MISKLITVIVLGGFVMASAAMYLLPVLIGWARHVPDLGVIAVIDVLLGWTFIGWVVALALALRSVNPAARWCSCAEQSPSPAIPAARPAAPGCRVGGATGPPPRRAESAPPLVLPPRPLAPGGPP